MHGNAYLDALADELRRIGGKVLRIENGSKHRKLVFAWGGREYVYPFPGRSRNKSAGREAVKDLRHMLGIRPPAGKSRQRNHSAEQTHPQPIPPPGAAPHLTMLPDPWEPLAEFRPLSRDPAIRAIQLRIEARVQLALYRLSFHPGTFARWQRDCRRAARDARRKRHD